MADGMVSNEHTVDSTSPTNPFFVFDPVHVRPILQRQMQSTTDRLGEQMALSIGDFDGRFLGQFPGELKRRENNEGYFFHMVGVNRGGDLSVAAP